MMNCAKKKFTWWGQRQVASSGAVKCVFCGLLSFRFKALHNSVFLDSGVFWRFWHDADVQTVTHTPIIVRVDLAPISHRF